MTRMLPAVIHQTCFDREGHCLHWVQYTVDGEAGLMDGSVLKQSGASDPHFAHPKKAIQGCGNPANDMSAEYWRAISATRPKATPPPTHGPRPITTAATCDRKQLASNLVRELARNQCWSVYSRDPRNHRVLKQHLFHKVPGEAEDPRAWSKHWEAEDAKRSALLKDVSPLLADLDAGHELCLSFGPVPFLDTYYQKLLPGADRFLMVEVKCAVFDPIVDEG